MMNQPDEKIVISYENKEMVVVDWIHTSLDEIITNCSRAGIQLPTAAELQDKLITYVNGLGDETDEDWKQCTLDLNGCL